MTTNASEVTEVTKPCRLPLAKLGRPHTHVRRVVLRFRRQLEAAVLAHGHIGVLEASRIHTACLAMRQAARIDRVLATAGEPGQVAGLTHTEWLAYSDRLLRAKEVVDRALSALGLDRDDRSIWDSIYATPPRLPVPSANGKPAAPDRVDAQQADSAGDRSPATEQDGVAKTPATEEPASAGRPEETAVEE